VHGTGQHFDDAGHRYVGSIQQGPFICISSVSGSVRDDCDDLAYEDLIPTGPDEAPPAEDLWGDELLYIIGRDCPALLTRHPELYRRCMADPDAVSEEILWPAAECVFWASVAKRMAEAAP